MLACGVCRTDLHVVDGELPQCRYPIVPGHEIVGQVARIGARAYGFAVGQRVGVPWLGGACGRCRFCHSGEENLCDEARFTGCHIDGGYQEFVLADYRFCLTLPNSYGDADAAPLLCAGLIGHRAHRMAGGAERLGIYGFGAAAHIMAQVARHQGQEVYAFTRPGDRRRAGIRPRLRRRVGRRLRPAAAGAARRRDHLRPGRAARAGGAPRRPQGRPGDHRRHPHERDPGVSLSILWGERMVRSVANLTRADGEDFMRIAEELPIITTVTAMPLEAGQRGARSAARRRAEQGAAVLVP